MLSRILLAFTLLLGAFTFIFFGFSKQYCAHSCKESFSLKIENGQAGTFEGRKVIPPAIDLAEKPDLKVLGEATGSGEKRIYVDLTTQTLKAYQGDTLFMETKVSTGKMFPTPTGEFTIWIKLRATRMTGGQGSTAYDLPNVPWVMFFGGSGIPDGQGFSLHGTYWHNNFGYPMSHGCVNLRTIDAEKLFYWVNLRGSESPTKIIINGKTPV